MTRKKWGIFTLFVILALALRFFHLDEKPPHHDETINGWHVLQMWKNGYYRYDPTNYHGPLLFYLFQWAEVLFGEGIWTLRAVPALASVLSVCLLAWWALRRSWLWGLGALVLLLSPAAEFYGRSGIHEALLALSILICLLSLDDWMQKGRDAFLALAMGAVAAALALKETTSLFILSGILAWIFTRPFQLDKKQWRPFLRSLVGVMVFLFVIFSGFLQDVRGVLEFFMAYLPWFKTGVHGSGHDKSFFYWSELTLKYDFGILLLAILSLWAFYQGSRRLRFFALWAWLHFLIYSLIPYKTPWCLITIQMPFVFAGCLVLVEFWQGGTCQKCRSFLLGILVVGAASQLPMIFITSLEHPLNLEHPFFYVQTEYGFKKVVDFLKLNRDRLGQRSICVGTAESWPLPWWAHEFNIKYLALVDEISKDCDIQIYDAHQKNRLETTLGPGFISREFETRQSRESAVIFIREELLAKMRGSWE